MTHLVTTSNPIYARFFSLMTTLALLVGLCACSNYRTNSHLSFSDRFPYEKPSIPIGKLDVTEDKLTYLGWINAEVTKPVPIAAPPTKEQVNLVLAELGKEKGADAVTFVSYKEGLAGNTLFGKGQAVKFNTLAHKPHSPQATPATKGSNTIVTPNTTKTLSPFDGQLATHAPIEKKAAVKAPTKRQSAFSTDSLSLILQNAEYLEKQAKLLNRQDMVLSSKLIQNLIKKQQKK